MVAQSDPLPPEAARLVAWPGYVERLDLDGEQAVRPDFAGLGLANVAPTALALLTGGAGSTTLPPLAEGVLPGPLTRDVRAVVVLAADGFGHLQLLREVEAGNAPNLARLVGSDASGDTSVHYAAITSVFPTTTVAALGSLNSGVTPAAHGLLGYTLYLAEYGGVAEMIRWGPLKRRGSFCDERHGGAVPERFFAAETLYQRLARQGVRATFAVNPSSFQATALTRMLHQGADYQGYVTTSSLPVLVDRCLRESVRPAYLYAYWPSIDTVAHLRGPRSDEHAAEVAAFDLALGRLLDHLPPNGDTLLLVTADHGHVETSVEREVRLNDFPPVVDLLAHPPAGERRAAYLHAKPGRERELEDTARACLGQFAAVLGREEAIRLGLFGPEPISDTARSRIGDVLLFPRGDLQVSFVQPETDVPESERPPAPPPFRGLHGGLSPDEALVPLLAVRR